MYKRLLVVALVLPALQNLGGEQRPETSAPKRVNAKRGVQAQTRRLQNAAVSAQSANLPPIVQQFGETSYYLKDIAMIDAKTGWAVGEPHWDQARHQYVGTIVKTQDAGTTWIAQDAGVAESFNGVYFVDANQGWAVGTNGTILHTSDGGAHWVREAVPTTDELRGVFFTGANAGWATGVRPVHHDGFGDEDDWLASVWHTSDGGQTWGQQQLPANASLLNRIDFVDSQTGWAVGAKFTGYRGEFAQQAGAIYHTSDGGRTWSEQYSPELPMTFTAVDFVDANNGWVVGFATESTVQGGAMFHTTDGGRTWGRQKLGSACEHNLWGIQFIDRSRGYAVGTMYGAAWGPPVCRTMDGGVTWTDIIMAQNDGEGLYGIAVVGNQVIAVGDHDFLATSTTPWDPGATQSSCFNNACLFTQRYLNTHYILYDASFVDRNRGWVVGSRSFRPSVWGQVILHTDDGGASWKTQYEHAPRADSTFSYHRLDRVYFTDPQNGWAVGASENGDDRKPHGGILHTTDGGSTWNEQGTELYASWNIEFSAVKFLNSREGWVLADGNFPSQDAFAAHTTDGGAHWTWVDTGIQASIAVGFGMVQGGMLWADPQHGWIAGWDKVLTTQDGGAHWSKTAVSCPEYDGGPQTSPLCYPGGNAIALSDAQNGWIAGEGLYHSTDGGAHWSVKISKSGWYHGIQFPDPRNGWLAGDNGELRYSNDGGASWQLLDSTTGVSLQGLYFLDPQHGWIVGDEGTILSYAADRTPTGQPGIFSVGNAASYQPGIAAGTFFTIWGTNLSVSTRTWSGADFVGGKLPTQLDGVRVNVNGNPAYISYISPSQINALAGADSSQGLVPVQVVTPRGTNDPFSAQQWSYAPGLFTWPPGLITMWTTQSSDYIVAQAVDGTWIGDFELANALGLGTHMRDAKPGEIITLYGTGFGATTPATPPDSLVTQPAKLAAPVTFRFGRTVADVVWAGQIGAGLYQFNIKVPDVASGSHVVAAEIGGHRSQGNAVVSVGLQ
jgi:uncharacterized protein (TIGR03437 family)